MSKKLFVGGYYQDYFLINTSYGSAFPKETFKHIYSDNILFNKDIEVYTLEEVLDLPFIYGVHDYYEEHFGGDFRFIPVEEQIKFILEYAESNEIAGVLYFETEEEAQKYNESVLEAIREEEEQKQED